MPTRNFANTYGALVFGDQSQSYQFYFTKSIKMLKLNLTGFYCIHAYMNFFFYEIYQDVEAKFGCFSSYKCVDPLVCLFYIFLWMYIEEVFLVSTTTKQWLILTKTQCLQSLHLWVQFAPVSLAQCHSATVLPIQQVLDYPYFQVLISTLLTLLISE